ncbi:DUF4129 domain-containing protein [Bacillus nitroreducens]
MGEMKDSRERIEDILKEKEYRVYYDESRNIFQEWWNRIKDWLADVLERLFPSISSANGAADVVLFLIMLSILFLLGLAVFLLIRNRRPKKFSTHKPLHSTEELNWTYQKHLQEAHKHQDVQDFSAATRHLFLALLLLFHQKKWLEAKAWKTNWEYYDELRKVNPTLANEFYDLALVFDEVAYGEYQINREEYIQFREKVFVRLIDTEGSEENAQR